MARDELLDPSPHFGDPLEAPLTGSRGSGGGDIQSNVDISVDMSMNDGAGTGAATAGQRGLQVFVEVWVGVKQFVSGHVQPIDRLRRASFSSLPGSAGSSA